MFPSPQTAYEPWMMTFLHDSHGILCEEKRMPRTLLFFSPVPISRRFLHERLEFFFLSLSSLFSIIVGFSGVER